MNGQEQKERATAVALLKKRVENLELVLTDAQQVETDSRMKADEHIKELFASMLDAETQFRKTALQAVYDKLTYEATVRFKFMEQQLNGFTLMPFWKRWGWCVFGSMFLVWTAPAELRRSYYAAAKAKKQARQDLINQKEIAAPMSDDNLRKQQSASERPQ